MSSASQHEIMMMVIVTVISLPVGIVAGRLWQRWNDIREWASFSQSFTAEELALINAHRLRREREGIPRQSIPKPH